jgi:ATP-binding cassette subfamily B protein
MDCGPAALKALMDGFGLHASYGRLREACHTDVDGTSIDTIEEIAVRLGLHATQVMVPLDHLLLSEAKILPCMVVVRLAGMGTHFVVVWRRHGPWLQLMDPATGRRWTRARHFLESVYLHEQKLAAEDWLVWARGPELLDSLRACMRQAGVRKQRAEQLIAAALEGEGWRPLAALDAAVHLAHSLGSASLVELVTQPELIPAEYWRVRESTVDEIIFRGAVALHCEGVKEPDLAALPESLRDTLTERSPTPARELARTFGSGGLGSIALALSAALAASGAVVVEALFLRSLFSLAPHLPRVGERFAAVGALLVFLVCIALIEWAMEDMLRASGRRLEIGLRTRFCLKIPRLGDRYFQSRLISDMAQRAHAVQILRGAPPLLVNLVRAFGSLGATLGGIIWFFPEAALPAVLCGVSAALIPVIAQPWLMERDLRFREYAGGLSRFYMDALLGIVPIRTHGAGPALRASQMVQLKQWASAGLRMQRSVVALEALQMTLGYGLAAWIVFTGMRANGNAAALILLVYWALSLPEMGRVVAASAWQWPGFRNSLLRLLEPLGAPEETLEEETAPLTRPAHCGGVHIEMRALEVAVAGHSILRNVNLIIPAGEHVGIVGLSGAGKSSLVGLLLGWYRVSAGSLLVDGEPLTPEGLHRLRRETAWVDPQVQLWNETLMENLRYGLTDDQLMDAGRAVGQANLASVIQGLPDGMQTKLGESGALLSGGEGQRVRMARAFGKPGVRLAILDEPARGLDRGMRTEFIERARAGWRDATLLCITHDVSSTRAFSRVLVIEDGQVIEDGDPSVLHAETRSRYRQLSDREDSVRARLWSAASWRRLRMENGQVVEEASK